MNERNAKWHQMTADAVIGQLHTNAACGLSRKAARSRFKKQGPNTLFDTKKRSFLQSDRSFFMDSAIFLMLGAVVLSAFFLPIDAFVAIVLALLVGALLLVLLVQRIYRNEKCVEKYRIPTVRVIRDGKMLIISAKHVVRGDLLILRKGDIVPCDCRLLASSDLRVLTLMPDDQGKPSYYLSLKHADKTYAFGENVVTPNYENMLYGASEIIAGEARAIAVETGKFTYVGAMESLVIPGEVGRLARTRDVLEDLKPFLRLYGFMMPILLIVLTIAGIFLSPRSMGIIDIFLPLCVLCGAASPVILLLYFRVVECYGLVDCMHRFPTENRAVIKSTGAIDRLSGVTDLIVVGRRACSDGACHFHAALIGRGVLRPDSAAAQPLLQPLCEAFLLLRDSLSRMLSKEARYAHPDSVFLSELISAGAYDEDAMKIRLQNTRFCQENGSGGYAVDVQMQDRQFRLIFTENLRLIDRCIVYEDGGIRRAISSQLRKEIVCFDRVMHEEAARRVAVIRQSGDGTLSFVGIVAQREQMQAVLPSVAEELSQCGVTVRFFLGENEQAYASAAKLSGAISVCDGEKKQIAAALLKDHRVFIGYSKEEILRSVQSLRAQGRHVAVLVGNAEDRLLLAGAPLVISCDPLNPLNEDITARAADAFEEDGKESSLRCAGVIRRHADMLVERAGRFTGGLSAILQTLTACRSVRFRMRLLFDVLFSTQLSRICLCLLSVMFGLGVQNGLLMIYSSFFVEIIALIWILSIQIPQNRLRRQCRFDEASMIKAILAREHWLPIVISIGCTVLYTAILSWCGVIGVGETSSYLSVSVILLQITALYFTVHQISGASFRILTYIPALVLLLPLGILIPLSMLFPTIGLGSWCLITLLSVPLMPGLYLLARFFLPFFRWTAK